MFSKYKSQILLEFLSGRRDQTTLASGQNLLIRGYQRHVHTRRFVANTTHPLTVAGAAQALAHPWRLYLHGHGNFERQTLGGQTVEELARYLAQCGLQRNLPDVISITACRLALGRGLSKYQVEPVASGDSFVGKLHRLLATQYGLYVTMHGRTMKVGIQTKQSHTPGLKAAQIPSTDLHIHKQPYSKITFFWENQQQKFRFAYGEES